MNRYLAFFLALVFASLTVSSACVAQPSEWVQFTLEPERGSDRIHASFSDDNRGRHEHNWSSGFKPSELMGLDVAGVRAGGPHQLRFARAREAGRMDCSCNRGKTHTAGNWRFSPT